MTATARSDIPQIALDARRAGELLLTPCPCRPDNNHRWLKAHTLGEHLHDATLAMNPGPRAQAFTPNTAPNAPQSASEPPPDPDKHSDYQKRLKALLDASRDLIRFVETHRPDQYAPTGPTFTDDEWCRNHLDTLGVCEPRYRGDMCRRCYGVHLTTGHLPPRPIMQAWRDGTRVTDTDLLHAITHANPKTKRRRKKAG